jgi:hypothetical protein
MMILSNIAGVYEDLGERQKARWVTDAATLNGSLPNRSSPHCCQFIYLSFVSFVLFAAKNRPKLMVRKYFINPQN